MNYKDFLKAAEALNTPHIGNNIFNATGKKLSTADQFAALVKKDDPCKYCGRNDTNVMYFYIKQSNEVICFDCVDRLGGKIEND